MGAYVVRRLAHTLVVLFGVSIVTFGLIHMIPGDPVLVMLGTDATPEELTRLRALLGFDQPIPVQYVDYMARVLQGQFGDSIIQKLPVSKLIMERLPATVELALAAILIAIALGVTTGVISATRPYSAFDAVAVIIALVGVAMPVFWLGMLAILLFSLRLSWLPSFGRGDGLFPSLALLITTGNTTSLVDSIKHLILPGVTLGAFSTAIISRLVRSSMLEVLGTDYVRTARAKGLADRAVLIRHALRNALIPVVTVVGLQVGVLLGSAVIAETIFAWPGLGRLLINAINTRDYPLVQALVFVIALIVSLINLTVDLLYAWLNPRVGHG
jgi:ABC-type dipeptide/oligopeptide/nickel transport system permease component